MAVKVDESYWKRGKVTERWGMTELACFAGQPRKPTRCDRHHEHHWCDVCEGYYGVPHDDCHGDGHTPQRHCVCRPCREFRAQYATDVDERRDRLTEHGSAYHHEFPPPTRLLA